MQSILYRIHQAPVNYIFWPLRFTGNVLKWKPHILWAVIFNPLITFLFYNVKICFQLRWKHFFDIISLIADQKRGVVFMNAPSDVWTMVLSLMEGNMTPTTIKTWFDDAEAVSLEDNKLVLRTPSEFKRDIIQTRYLPQIQAALKELFSADFEVQLLIEGEEYRPKQTDSAFFSGTDEYTFEKFVVGSSNKFAHAAALTVAENPGSAYNPLFIYGQSGLGKTHLLCAIAHRIHQNHPDFRITYSKGDAFTNELIQGIREGGTRSSGRNTALPTSFWWTTYSSSPGGSPARRRCFTPSTPCMKRASRLSSPQTGRPRRCCGWTTGCVPGLSGACLWTSSPPTMRPGWLSSKTRPSGGA